MEIKLCLIKTTNMSTVSTKKKKRMRKQIFMKITLEEKKREQILCSITY